MNSSFIINFVIALSLATFCFSAKAKAQRIIALSPHLIEIVYALNKQDGLIAASDYSDYPQEAKQLPSVANYQGANIAEIIRLSPTHILTWKGGNKQQDIERLKSLGFAVYESAPENIFDLSEDIRQIALFLNAVTGESLAQDIEQRLALLQQGHESQAVIKVSYLMNLQPLSGAGKDPWINSLLDLCGFENIYYKGVSSYIQISTADLIRQSPKALIVGMHVEEGVLRAEFKRHEHVFKPQILRVNPDTFHRFTPRAITELEALCATRKKLFN